MPTDNDLTQALTERVHAAIASGQALDLRGAGTKPFLGRQSPEAGPAQPLELSGHSGILEYEPKELVITARCGTPLDVIDAALAAHGQQLPFEPPRLAAQAGLGADGIPTQGQTIGGTIACGLSGPARPYAGSARDLVLGARVLTGRGEVLRFGGTVMKNVAGYDVSRLMVGAYGTLGVLLDISLKVLPIPDATLTLVRRSSDAEALALMASWGAKPLPVTATCWDGECLWVRLAGTKQGVLAAAQTLGGDRADDADRFWTSAIRDQHHPFFAGDTPLWRLALPGAAPPLDLPGPQLIEWGGCQRWLRSAAEPDAIRAAIRAAVAQAGGHATLLRGGDRTGEVFHPLAPPLLALHKNLKLAFDPQGILNPGRVYPGL